MLLSISYKLEQWQVRLDCGLEAPYGYMKTYRYPSPVLTPDPFELVDAERKWEELVEFSNSSRLGKRKFQVGETLPQKRRIKAIQQHKCEGTILDSRDIFLCGRYQLRGKNRQHRHPNVSHADYLGTLQKQRYRTSANFVEGEGISLVPKSVPAPFSFSIIEVTKA